MVYRPYTACAGLVARRVLRVRPDSGVEKVVVNFLAFLFSGCCHALVSWRIGHRCGIWKGVGWFGGNFGAIVVERGVQTGFRRVFGSQAGKSRWGRFFGYVWVFAFMFWSVPKWQDPKVICGLSGRA